MIGSNYFTTNKSLWLFLPVELVVGDGAREDAGKDVREKSPKMKLKVCHIFKGIMAAMVTSYKNLCLSSCPIQSRTRYHRWVCSGEG